MRSLIPGSTAIFILAALLATGLSSNLKASYCLEPDQEAQPVDRTPPAYPHPAMLMCIEGNVVLEITVNEAGRVDAARVLESEPPGIFDRAARRAIDQWQYLPECRDGQPTTRTLETQIEFALFSDGSTDCPDKPTQLDDSTLTLLGEIGALYALAADWHNGSLAIDQLQAAIAGAAEPTLDDVARQVWRYHRNGLLAKIDLRQTAWQRLHELGFPDLLLSTQTFINDPDMTQTLAALGEMRAALDDYIGRLKATHQKVRARHEALASRTDYDQATLELLTHSFSGSLDRDKLEKEISNLEEQFQLTSEIVELLVAEQGNWHADQSAPQFDDPELTDIFYKRLLRLNELVQKDRQHARAAYRGYEDYSLSD